MTWTPKMENLCYYEHDQFTQGVLTKENGKYHLSLGDKTLSFNAKAWASDDRVCSTPGLLISEQGLISPLKTLQLRNTSFRKIYKWGQKT